MAEIPGSPPWWLEMLSDALDARAQKVREAENWYSGDHPIPDPPPNTLAHYDHETRVAFDRLARLGITNFVGPVVDVPASKLRVEGFRFGDGTPAGDAEAWTIWQRNHLDADSDIGNETALKTGAVYALVWAGADDKAQITIEDPSQSIVAYRPGTRRERAAGLKRWVDESGMLFATLYLPNGIWKYKGVSRPEGGVPRTSNPTAMAFFDTPRSTSQLVLPSGVSRWTQRTVEGEEWPLPNPLGVVPLVELSVNGPVRRPAFGGGLPEFSRQLTDQRRINQTMLNMLITMEHQAFRQRWVVGWTPPVNKTTGEVDKLAVLKAGASTFMMFGDSAETVKVGEFAQADFAPFLQAIERDVKSIAATSATPPYAFLLGDMINVAADSLARIEGQLTSKIRRHQRGLGEGWEEVLRLALAVEGSAKASDTSSSIIWAEAEERTGAEQVEIARAIKELGGPDEAVWAALPGIDQQEALRWKRSTEAGTILSDSRQLSAAEMIQKLYLGVGVVVTREEARNILRDAGVDLSEIGPEDFPEPVEPVAP